MVIKAFNEYEKRIQEKDRKKKNKTDAATICIEEGGRMVSLTNVVQSS